jgi:two-component system, chemotaxis family, CheB/CheR fusion protein
MPKKTSRKRPTKSRVPASSVRILAAKANAGQSLESATRGRAFPVVGIGASAGGFEAVLQLLKNLPADTGMAFVVLLHLDPRHRSKLPELLARSTTMTVREIGDGILLEPNQVYILPANADVVLSQGRLRLVRRPEGERLHLPIDQFFTSLANEQGSRAIGIVLSGTGSDGTAGLGAIKAEAGLTYAEAESSAKYFGMPRSAIDAGCVDTVLSADAIAAELARVARHPLVRPRAKVREVASFPEAADALGKIFFLLRQNSGVDFSLYKPTTLKRRITRRMVLQRIENVDDYVTLLRANPQELDALFRDLLINVTSFFRDKKVYAALKKKIISRLIKTKASAGEIRVWVPGCATGEEVYSLAICFMEEIKRASKSLKLHLFGTDLSEQAINKARIGVFPGTIVRDVSPERLRRFFAKSNGGYQISRDIREICTFARQNLCEDPPFSRLDLISCRNVLIYLGPEMQKKCMPVFHYALNSGGYLMLGMSETVGTAVDLFTLMDKKNKIYIKKHVSIPTSPGFTSKPVAPARVSESAKPAAFRNEASEGPFDLQTEADRIILSRYAPSGVIIDTQMRVHEFRGRTGRFLEHSPGTATLNLLQMVHSGLVVDLRTAIHKALKNGSPVRKDGILLKTNGSPHEVAMEVVPFHIPRSSETWILVLFEEEAFHEPKHGVREKKHTSKAGNDPRDKEIAHLRSELDANKESLQAIIEEQEATNEELKSANEEIESSNEELQSTNEELETAKEELQSTNEELITLNEELSNRNLEMAQMNNDLTNLLSSTSIPIIMVDNSLAVRRATPLAEKLFNLIPTDIGRRLSDLKANLHIENLDEMIREVIETLSTREQKVQDTQGRWYSLRIRPYRTRENKIDGAVITLLDIDETQRIIARLELASEYSDAILETIHEPLVVLDSELRVRKASRAFYDGFKLTRRKTDGVRFTDIGTDGEWDIPHLRSLLQEVLPKSKRLENFTVDVTLRQLGQRKLVFNARRLENKGEPLVLLAIGDLTVAQAVQRPNAAKP